MARKNKGIDIFRHIDMLNGPEYTDPDTGEISRCWPWIGGLNSEGRPYFSIGGQKVIAYRHVYELVKGETLGKQMFRHKCDNEVCCNPAHGIAGTHDENMNDMKTRERHGLPHHTVRFIRGLDKKGIPRATIQEMTGLSKTTITDIINRKNYDHVSDDEPTGQNEQPIRTSESDTQSESGD